MFEMFQRLFRRGETPALVVDDPVLGKLVWSDDDASWFGTYRDVKFSLGYSGASTPAPEVRAYATRILNDSAWLADTLTQSRTEALAEHSACFAAEIQSLTLGTIHFCIHPKRGEYALADLEGGKDSREWRIEFSGSTCEGIGFDD